MTGLFRDDILRQACCRPFGKRGIIQHLKQTKSQQLIVDELATLRAAADIEVLAAQ